jgi:hypothetical protein
LMKARILEGALPGGPPPMTQMALSFTAPSKLVQQKGEGG